MIVILKITPTKHKTPYQYRSNAGQSQILCINTDPAPATVQSSLGIHGKSNYGGNDQINA